MRRKRRSAVIVPVASMGDIAFLLIIFFMVCSNMESYKLQPPQAPNLAELERSMTIVGIDEKGVIYLDGVKVPDDTAVQYGVAAKIEQRRRLLEPGESDQKAREVLFRCDKNIDRQYYQPVISAISRGGGIIAAVGTGTDKK